MSPNKRKMSGIVFDCYSGQPLAVGIIGKHFSTGIFGQKVYWEAVLSELSDQFGSFRMFTSATVPDSFSRALHSVGHLTTTE